MILTATTCECCSDVTYHIPFTVNDMTLEDGEFVAHLTEDEATDLYFQLKEYKTGMKSPE